MTYLDPSQIREAASGESDTRQWISYGTVEPETAGQKSVTFTKEYGPLVNVKLHPSGIPVVCRVAHEVAGNGEGEWFPFLAGDEVAVGIPEGDEKAGCVILGRLNQEIDAFPSLVAGQDPSANNFAFRRLRTPYIFETAAGYLVRNATTGAFFSISDIGAITLAANSGKDFLALTPDFLGLQNASADVLIQIALGAKQVVLEAAGTKMILDANLSYLYSQGTLQLGTSGNPAAWHATSAEAMINFVANIVTGIGALLTLPLTPPQVIALVNVAITASGATSVGAYQAALKIALAVPGGPGVGTPGLLIG